MDIFVAVLASVGIKLKELGDPLPRSGTPHKRRSGGFSPGKILKSEMGSIPVNPPGNFHNGLLPAASQHKGSTVTASQLSSTSISCTSAHAVILEYSSTRVFDGVLSSKLFDINISNPQSTSCRLFARYFHQHVVLFAGWKSNLANNQMSVQARFVGHLHECLTLCCSAFLSIFTGLLLSPCTPSASLTYGVSEWVSNFLTAHQHIIGYSVPYNGLENAIKDGKYNQGYLATIKYE